MAKKVLLVDDGEKLWKMLDEGLYLGEFASTLKSRISNFPITILKINPEFYSFNLQCASEHDGNMRIAKQWCNEFGLLAVLFTMVLMIAMLNPEHNL